MNLTELNRRLLERLRKLLETGTLTESALARRLGLSQPHLHNILKGIRGLTTATADQWLHRMHWSVWDLLEEEELRAEVARRKAAPRSKSRDVPLAPISHWITSTAAPPTSARHLVPKAALAGIAQPVLIVVEEGTDTGGLAQIGDILLADYGCGESESGNAYVLLSVEGRLQLRWARKGARCLHLASSENWHHPMRWETITGPIRLIARIHGVAKRPTDTFQPLAPPSAAS